MGLEARIVDEELFLESLGEVELIAGANLVSKAVRKYDLMTVNGRARESQMLVGAYFGTGRGDYLKGPIMFFQTFRDCFGAGGDP